MTAAPYLLTPVEPDADSDVQVETHPHTEAALEPPADVFIHNDELTTMEFVTVVLRTVFELSKAEAERVMLRAHVVGVAYVCTLGLEEAKYRVGKAHSLARAAGYPLTFSIELATST